VGAGGAWPPIAYVPEFRFTNKIGSYAEARSPGRGGRAGWTKSGQSWICLAGRPSGRITA
jgi:hypothetical protein